MLQKMPWNPDLCSDARPELCWYILRDLKLFDFLIALVSAMEVVKMHISKDNGKGYAQKYWRWNLY
jgi:hypothetical protein